MRDHEILEEQASSSEESASREPVGGGVDQPAQRQFVLMRRAGQRPHESLRQLRRRGAWLTLQTRKRSFVPAVFSFLQGRSRDTAGVDASTRASVQKGARSTPSSLAEAAKHVRILQQEARGGRPERRTVELCPSARRSA